MFTPMSVPAVVRGSTVSTQAYAKAVFSFLFEEAVSMGEQFLRENGLSDDQAWQGLRDAMQNMEAGLQAADDGQATMKSEAA